MTNLLFQKDCYKKAFTSLVTGVDEENHGIILDQTAFFPGGGGQPGDHGSLQINQKIVHVTGMKRQGGNIIHLIEKNEVLPETGMAVTGEIDWQRRYKLMRTHTALHILCGVVWRDYKALVTGGNMEPLKGRMDFEFETLQHHLVKEIEEKINVEVNKAHDIRIEIIPRQKAFQIPDLIRTKINLLPEGIKEVRTVEIVGLDLQADGGTHVANTKEVGKAHIVDYKSKGKINKRIYLELEE